jgi:hypothetical protein
VTADDLAHGGGDDRRRAHRVEDAVEVVAVVIFDEWP